MRRPILVLLLVVGAIVAGTLAPTSAAAQPKASFSTVRYTPAIGPGNYLALDGTRVLARGAYTYALGFDYANDVLVVDDPCGGLDNVMRCQSGQVSFLEHAGLVHLGLALGVLDRLQVMADLPLGGTGAHELGYEIANAGASNPFRYVGPRDGFVLGDLRFGAKYRAWEGLARQLAVAVAGFATLPTGLLTSDRDCERAGTCTFVGEKGMQIGASGIAEYAPLAMLRMAATVGVTYRPQRDFLGVETGTELTLGVGASYEILPRLSAKAELAAGLELAGLDDTPVEARGGLSYGRDVVVTLGAGAGIIGDEGSPRYRLIAAVQWTPTVHDEDGDRVDDGDDRCPRVPEDRDGFEDSDGCPDDDDDNDGIVDARDGCDRDREDRDGFLDDDGCPELDNDDDGVPDGYDTCEGEKEDRDGDHDDDGCPDDDRDRDGVADAVDRCPDQAEDTDALGDEDGCPETDHDGDGVPDTEDACPEQPIGKKRLPQTARGCPSR